MRIGLWSSSVVGVLVLSACSGSPGTEADSAARNASEEADPNGVDDTASGDSGAMAVPGATEVAAFDPSAGPVSDATVGGSTTGEGLATPTAAVPLAPGVPVAAGAAPDGVTEPGTLPSSDPIAAPEPLPQAGTLTAGAWDDNLNFDRFLEFQAGLHDQQLPGLLPLSVEEQTDAEQIWADALRPHTTLDVSLVIDTTGSMGDELSYLQTEFDAIATRIQTAYPNAEQRWSLVVYRDIGDEYVTRSFDFSADLDAFRNDLGAQLPSGGGDFPEAPEAALEVMNQLQWRTGVDTARLAFWVADAPHHGGQAAALAAELRTAQELDIHLYPVASSGIDTLTEHTMRSAAQLSGGRYLFLTDDSGVGGQHLEPSIPCYFVTRLDTAILRMVDIEMSGEYREPAEEEIIRRSGDPQEGACQLESGEQVHSF